MKYQGKITDPKDLVTKEYVDTGLSGKLGTSGDGSNVTAAFNAASSRTNISTGEKLTVIFGKIAKWFADLGAAAFRGVDSVPTANSTNLVESGGVKSALTSLESDLAEIHQTGTTCTETNGITSGTYFYLNGTLVQALVDIADGALFTEGTNYEVPPAGSLNSLKSALDTFGNRFKFYGRFANGANTDRTYTINLNNGDGHLFVLAVDRYNYPDAKWGLYLIQRGINSVSASMSYVAVIDSPNVTITLTAPRQLTLHLTETYTEAVLYSI